MTTPTAPQPLEWDFGQRGVRHAATSLAIFGVLYALAMWAGLTLHEAGERLTIVWPASGLLLMALWLAPYRRWAVLIALQLIIETVCGGKLVRGFGALEGTCRFRSPIGWTAWSAR